MNTQIRQTQTTKINHTDRHTSNNNYYIFALLFYTTFTATLKKKGSVKKDIKTSKMPNKYVSEINPFGFHEVVFPIEKIILNDKNPRKITAKNKRELSKSLDKFGLIDKPILNKDFTLIAGHQRVSILLEKKVKEVPCMIPEILLTNEQAEELLLRHNKNTGTFDDNKLKLFDYDKLLEFGFDRSELSFFNEIVKEFDLGEPILPLVQEPNEEYDYVMIFARNSIEKTFLHTFFELRKEIDYKSTQVGMGRIVEFSRFEEVLNKAIKKRKTADK